MEDSTKQIVIAVVASAAAAATAALVSHWLTKQSTIESISKGTTPLPAGATPTTTGNAPIVATPQPPPQQQQPQQGQQQSPPQQQGQNQGNKPIGPPKLVDDTATSDLAKAAAISLGPLWQEGGGTGIGPIFW